MDEKRVVAIGFFDGVHLGHGALLRRARQVADRLGLPAAALTFDRHPSALLGGEPVPLINTAEERAELMRRLYGIDQVLFCRFDRAMMEMPWRTYVSEYLRQELGAVHVVCGHDHRFGWRGEGNPARLQQACTQLGMGCDVVQRVELHGQTVSSTLIRSLLRTGQIREANAFLGHPHCLTGTVVHGRQLGRRLGTPTANVLLPDGVLAPAFGVYATAVAFGGRRYPAVTNVGVRPTFANGNTASVESYILDYSGNLYGKRVRVEFYTFIRPERRFDCPEALRAQILTDECAVREYFKSR